MLLLLLCLPAQSWVVSDCFLALQLQCRVRWPLPYRAHRIPLTPLPPLALLASCYYWSLGALSSLIGSLNSAQASENSIFVLINLFSTSIFTNNPYNWKGSSEHYYPQPCPNDSNHQRA